MVVTSSDDSSATVPIQTHQHGLGTLSRLPMEIRLMIWQELMPEAGSGDGNRGPQALRHFCTVADKPVDQSEQPGNLSILRASRPFYHEILEELYRSRVLTVCFNPTMHHFPLCSTHLCTTIGGICKSMDFRYADFSKFTSLRLNIRLPSEDDPFAVLPELVLDLHQLVNVILSWQEETFQGLEPSCPRIDIVIDRCSHIPNDPVWEICLEDIADILSPLAKIANVEDASIEIRFPLRFGQEWLPELKRQMIGNMRDGRQEIRREGWRIKVALQQSRWLTGTSAGSGPLHVAPSYRQPSIPLSTLLKG
ncbi:MAG: hypothetical protein Q9216_005723 [Gyalolechia sp. 2 TL-2023]